MICARPYCGNEEDRINGYCSEYCQDLAELQIEAEIHLTAKRTLQTENDRLKAERDRDTKVLARQAVELERLQEIECRYRLRISELNTELDQANAEIAAHEWKLSERTV